MDKWDELILHQANKAKELNIMPLDFIKFNIFSLCQSICAMNYIASCAVINIDEVCTTIKDLVEKGLEEIHQENKTATKH